MKSLFLCAGAAFALGGLLATGAHAFRKDTVVTARAREFLAALSPAQRDKAAYAFDSGERFNWHFVPKDRNGLPLKEMTLLQREAAARLLRASLSAQGVKRAETLRALENVLREIEQGRGPARDPELYYFTVFGAPADKGVWGWRYEGHHISLQWVMKDGRASASTPQFFGSNPGEVREGPMKGTRLLATEEDLGRELVKSLDDAQQAEAVLSETAPPDILTGNSRKAAIQEDKGVPYARLKPAQKKLLERLIAQHAAPHSPEIARKRMDAVRRDGLASVKFAWMGGQERGQGHYYRVQGKGFLIEYDNTQNNANHPHTAWRDFRGDFGEDLLANHYRRFPHRLAKK